MPLRPIPPLATLEKSFELTERQLEELQSEDSWLRGAAALDILNTAVKETGVVVKPEHVFKRISPEVVTTAITSVFPLIGGVPAFALWASTNRTEYYKLLAKLAPTEQNISGGGNTVVITQVPDSPLDVIDLTGK